MRRVNLDIEDRRLLPTEPNYWSTRTVLLLLVMLPAVDTSNLHDLD